MPSDGGLAWSPPGSDVNTSLLGPEAPAYYELAGPAGEYAGTSPAGVVMLVHGGGWYTVGAPAVAAMRQEALVWRERGWSTLSVTYRGCERSLDDVLWFVDTIERVAPGIPLCISGGSAGGHLALLAAAKRPTVDCVLSRGAPTDVLSLPQQEAYDPATGDTQNAGPTWAYELAVAAFGSDSLAAMSPITYADELSSTSVVLATAQHDPFIPLDQGREMAAAVRSVRSDAAIEVVELAPGPVPFVHASVSQEALSSLRALEDSIVESFLEPLAV